MSISFNHCILQNERPWRADAGRKPVAAAAAEFECSPFINYTTSTGRMCSAEARWRVAAPSMFLLGLRTDKSLSTRDELSNNSQTRTGLSVTCLTIEPQIHPSIRALGRSRSQYFDGARANRQRFRHRTGNRNGDVGACMCLAPNLEELLRGGRQPRRSRRP